MAPVITPLNISEPYAALTILRESQLNTEAASIEDYVNAEVILNMQQMALDAFGNSYVFTNDGVAQFVTPLIDQAALLDDNETITGDWTFTGVTAFGAAVSSTSTFSSSGQGRASVFRTTSNQSIADSTPTAISFQSETYDVGALHDNSVNPSRISIPSGMSGVFEINAQATFAASNTGRREIYIYKNGSKIAENKNFGPHATEQTVLQISTQDVASVNDYYEIFVYQNSGGNLDIVLGQYTTFFCAMKVW